MAWILGLLLVVALLLAVWCFLAAIHLAGVANRAQDEAAATRLALVAALLKAADEQTAKESALRLLDDQTRLRRSELDLLTAQLDALSHEYRRVSQLYRDAATSRRVH